MNRRARVKRLAGLGTRFLLVGGLSTLIEIAVFNLAYFVFGWDVVTAKIVASLVALVNAYFGNREWTFRDRGHHTRWLEVTLFIVVNAFCTGLGAAIVYVGALAAESVMQAPVGPLSLNIINLASIVIIVVVRFFLYHFIVFRGKRASKTVEVDV